MTKTQIAKQESYTRVKGTIDKSPTIVEPVIGLSDEVDDLDATILQIIKASTTQIAEPIGITKSESTKLIMADTVIKFILRGKVKAKRLGLLNIVNQLDETHTFFVKGSKLEIISRAKAVRNVLNDNKTVLVVITAADITVIDGVISNYEVVKDEPVVAKIITKAAGTDLLPPLFKSADASVVNILDLIESYIGKTNPAFTNEIKLDAELRISGERHTSADFHVLNEEDDSSLLNSLVEDTSNSKIYKPGTDHITIIPTHHPGSFTFNISCPGFQSVVFATQLSRGVINNFTIRLKKNP